MCEALGCTLCVIECVTPRSWWPVSACVKCELVERGPPPGPGETAEPAEGRSLRRGGARGGVGSGGRVQALLAWLVVAGCSCPARVNGGAAAPCAPWGQRAEDSIADAAWSRSADAGYGRVSENQGCGSGDPARVGEAGVMAGLRGRGAGAGALGGAELEERDGAVRHGADAHMHTRALGGTPPSRIAREARAEGALYTPPPHLETPISSREGKPPAPAR